jgi:hypothetical protein
MDKGRLTDRQGCTVDFSNMTVITQNSVFKACSWCLGGGISLVIQRRDMRLSYQQQPQVTCTDQQQGKRGGIGPRVLHEFVDDSAVWLVALNKRELCFLFHPNWWGHKKNLAKLTYYHPCCQAEFRRFDLRPLSSLDGEGRFFNFSGMNFISYERSYHVSPKETSRWRT